MKWIVGFVPLLLCFSSCSHTPSPPQKVIRLNLHTEPLTMDPRKGGDVISSHMHFLLFEGLVKLDADGSILPAQAERIDVSEDRLTYTFHLRESKWSNGDLVTAHDFAKAWKDILSPSFPAANAHLLYPIQNAESAKKGLVCLDQVGIQALDDKTLRITLTTPTPYFLDLVSFCVFFPVHQQIDKKNPNWALNAGKDFVSNGPYQLVSWKHKDELSVIRNPFYWNKDNVKTEKIHFSMVSNEMTALELFEKGKIDMLGYPLSPLPTDALSSLQHQQQLKTHPTPATIIITFNTQTFPFRNAHIRKAFAYAINRKTIVENITQLGEEIALSMIPPILKKGDKKVRFFEDHAIEKAREELKLGMQELGIKRSDLQHLTYHYHGAETNKQIAETLQQQWAEVLGLHVQIEGVEYVVLIDKLSKHNYTFGQNFWAAQYSDPMNILERFKFAKNAKNYPGWESPEFISLLNTSAYFTGKEREALLEKAEALLLNEMPLTTLFHQDAAYIVQPHLQGFSLSPIGDIYFERLVRSD